MEKLSNQLKEQIASRPTNTYLRNQSKFVEYQYKTMPKARPQRTNIKIPDSFDGRKVWGNLLSPIMNQGSCGSCWAFASTSTLADRFNIQSLGLLDLQLSPVKLILCDFKGKEFQVKHPETDPGKFAQLNSKNLQSNACYGNTLYDAWRYLYVIGTNTEECLPYNNRFNEDKEQDFKSLSKFQKATELPLCTVIAGKIGDMCSNVRYDSETGEERGTPSRFYRALHFYAIAGTSQDDGNEYNIRHNIYCWGPVSSGFDVYPDFYTFDAKNGIYEWNGKGPRVGGHAIEIMGWGEQNNKKYWIIKNSWGKEWGDNGYFKMVRGNNNCKIEENIITGVPDFFYPENYKLSYNKIWLENPKTQFQRHEIEDEISITGGGIDSTTGYTRRVMVTKPWLNLSRPINLTDLPTWDTFVAGINSHPRKRFRYQNLIKQKHRDVIYNKNVLWLVVIVVTILLLLILLVLYEKYKNEISLENIK